MSETIERDHTYVNEKWWITLWIVTSCAMYFLGIEDSLFGSFLSSLFLTLGLGLFGGMIGVGLIRVVLVAVVLELLMIILPPSINTFLRIPKLIKIVDDHFEYEMFLWTFILAISFNTLLIVQALP